MIIKKIINLIYVSTILISIIVTFATKNLRIVMLGLIVLAILYTLFTIQLTFFDERLKVPQSKILMTTGDAVFKIKVTKYLYGTYPIFIYSGEEKVAEVYRGADLLLSLSPDRPIAVSRESVYKNVEGTTELRTDAINHISEKDEIGNIIVDFYSEDDVIDDRPYASEYEKMRAAFWSMDLFMAGAAVTAILALLAAYFRMRYMCPRNLH